MRIIFSNFDDIKNPHYGGGGAFAVHEVAKRLAVKHEVMVVTGRYPNSKDEKVDNVLYKRIGFDRTGPRLGQALYQILLPWYVRHLEFDVWVESFTPPFSTACLQLITKKPVIGLVHSLSGKDMRRRYKLPFDAVERMGLKTYKHIIVLTQYMYDHIRSVSLKPKLTVIPNGIESEYIQQEVGQKDNYILCIGRIDIEQKGLDLLIEAYKHLAHNTDTHLVIAGGGAQNEIDNLKKLIKKADLEDRVKLVGKVDGKEKWNLLNKSLLVVAPSRGENFALIALEAFCAESAFVAFDIPGFSWIPAECISKAKPFSAESLAGTMLTLLRDPSIRTGQTKKAKQFVTQFDWDTIAGRYEQVIEISHT